MVDLFGLALVCCFVAATVSAQDPHAIDAARAAAFAVDPVARMAVDATELCCSDVCCSDVCFSDVCFSDVCFSGDGRYLAVTQQRAAVVVHDLTRQGESVVATVPAEDVLAGALVGSRFATCSLEHLRFVDARTGKIERELALPAYGEDRPVVGPTGFRLARALVGPGEERVWLSIAGPVDFVPSGGMARYEFHSIENEDYEWLRSGLVASCLAVHPDGQVLFCGETPRACGNASRQGGLYTVTRDGRRSGNLQDLYVPRAADFTVDGRELVVVDGMYARRLSVADGEVMVKRSSGAEWIGVIDPVLALAHDGADVQVWELASLRCARTVLSCDRIRSIVLSPKRDRLAVAANAEVRVFDLRR